MLACLGGSFAQPTDGSYHCVLQSYGMAADYYLGSDTGLDMVIEKILDIRAPDAAHRARALIGYLDKVLFNAAVFSKWQQVEAVGDTIIRHYCKYAKGKLATVILESYLSCYDRGLALQLLEEMQNDRNGSGNAASWSAYTVQPKNVFARAILYLETRQLEQAKRDLLLVEPEILVEFCLSHPRLLGTNESGGIRVHLTDVRHLFRDWNHTFERRSYRSEAWRSHIALANPVATLALDCN